MNELDYPALRFWFDAAQVAFMAGVTVYVWWTNRTRATREAIEMVDRRVEAGERRIDAIEHELHHLPNHKHLAHLERRIEAIHGDLKELVGSLGGIRRAVDLMNQHLLERNNR